MHLADISVIKVTHETTTALDRVGMGEVCNEARECLDPRVVILPEEKIVHFLMAILRDIPTMTTLAFSSKKLNTLIATPNLS